MTDTLKLQGKMKEHGYTIKKLASELHLSSTGLFNKIHNKKEFLCSEVIQIGILLEISESEISNIFFAKNVE